jgi:hypothetical protein
MFSQAKCAGAKLGHLIPKYWSIPSSNRFGPYLWVLMETKFEPIEVSLT